MSTLQTSTEFSSHTFGSADEMKTYAKILNASSGISLYGCDDNTREPGLSTTGVDKGGCARRKRKLGKTALGSYTSQVFGSGDIVDTVGVIYAPQCQPTHGTGTTNVTDSVRRTTQNSISICRYIVHQSTHVPTDTRVLQEHEPLWKTRTQGTRRHCPEPVETNHVQGSGSGSQHTGPPIEYNAFGPCHCVCRSCNARFWYEERLRSPIRWENIIAH